MKRYIRSDSNSTALNKLGVTPQEFEVIKKWCDSADSDSYINFYDKKSGSTITNPLMDPTGRYELSLTEAIKTYGLKNMTKFCKTVIAYDVDIKIVDVIEDDPVTTVIFLYTSGLGSKGNGYWYWIVDTDDVKRYATVEDFINDPDNTGLGYSAAFFDTLEEAKDDYYSDMY